MTTSHKHMSPLVAVLPDEPLPPSLPCLTTRSCKASQPVDTHWPQLSSRGCEQQPPQQHGQYKCSYSRQQGRDTDRSPSTTNRARLIGAIRTLSNLTSTYPLGGRVATHSLAAGRPLRPRRASARALSHSWACGSPNDVFDDIRDAPEALF